MPKTLLLVSYVNIQYARDDEESYFCINQNKHIGDDLCCNSNESPIINYLPSNYVRIVCTASVLTTKL